jgi:hypothetical protein
MDDEWVKANAESMARIAPILDSLEAEINSQGPVDLLQAYVIAYGAIKEVDMDKEHLERFVAVLMADRTHHAIT